MSVWLTTYLNVLLKRQPRQETSGVCIFQNKRCAFVTSEPIGGSVASLSTSKRQTRKRTGTKQIHLSNDREGVTFPSYFTWLTNVKFGFSVFRFQALTGECNSRLLTARKVKWPWLWCQHLALTCLCIETIYLYPASFLRVTFIYDN